MAPLVAVQALGATVALEVMAGRAVLLGTPETAAQWATPEWGAPQVMAVRQVE